MKRYDHMAICNDYDEWSTMEEISDGEWVKYSEANEEIKKLREALEEIRDYGHAETHEDAYNMMEIAEEALKDGE